MPETEEGGPEFCCSICDHPYNTQEKADFCAADCAQRKPMYGIEKDVTVKFMREGGKVVEIKIITRVLGENPFRWHKVFQYTVELYCGQGRIRVLEGYLAAIKRIN